MTPALWVSFGSSLDLALAVFGAVASLAAGWYAWRRAPLKDGRIRAAIATLRAVFVLALFLLVADPIVTRTVERLPRLAVVWEERGAFEVADAPGATPRREALERALDAAMGEIGRRFEVAGAGEPGVAASLLVTDGGVGAGAVERLEGVVAALEPARDPDIPDLSIVDVELPRRAAPGAPVTARVTVRARAAAGRAAVVTVSDAARMLATGAHDVAAPDDVAALDLTFVPQSSGLQPITVEVAGLTGEVALDDNRAERWIDLDGPVRRVLFVEGEPTWEGKFVRRALESDPTIRVDYLARVSKAATLAQPEVDEEERAGSWDDLQAIVGDTRRLFDYEAVILGPLDASLLDGGAVSRLVAFVDRRGGGLVVLGSNGYAGSILAARGELAATMPGTVRSGSLARREGGAPDAKGSVLLAPGGGTAGHPIFAGLGVDPGGRLAKLQRLGSDYLKLESLAPGARAVAVDAERQAPLVAVQEYGAGRTVLVTPADTWKLVVGAPAEVEDTAARLWSGIVAWAAGNARERVSVDVLGAQVAAGEPVEVELLARDGAFEPVARAEVAGTARLEGGEREVTLPLALAPVAAAPGAYHASFVPPFEGTWAIEVSAGDERAGLRVHAAAAAAFGDADPVARARFAAAVRARGGEVVPSDEPERIVAALPERASVVEDRVSRPARHAAWPFVLPLLFAAEIFLRRRYGLV